MRTTSLPPEMPTEEIAEHETSLLGSILLLPTVLQRVRLIVCGADFHNGDFGELFEARIILNDAGKPVGDPLYLHGELPKMKIRTEVCNALSSLGQSCVFRMPPNS